MNLVQNVHWGKFFVFVFLFFFFQLLLVISGMLCRLISRKVLLWLNSRDLSKWKSLIGFLFVCVFVCLFVCFLLIICIFLLILLIMFYFLYISCICWLSCIYRLNCKYCKNYFVLCLEHFCEFVARYKSTLLSLLRIIKGGSNPQQTCYKKRKNTHTMHSALVLYYVTCFVMMPVLSIKCCAIASYHLFHSHAQVYFLTDSTRWTGVYKNLSLLYKKLLKWWFEN